METAVVILAGGGSARMGRDKSRLPLGGRPLAEALAERYRPLGEAVYLSVSHPAEPAVPGAVLLPDLRPGQGPLAGLEAAFASTPAERVFLTAVDLPFGEPALARLLLDALGEGDACLLRRAGRPEPLFAAYRRSCLPQVRACLDGGRRAMGALLDRLDCRFLEGRALAGFDLDRALFNANTPEDWARAERLCAGRGAGPLPGGRRNGKTGKI